MATLTEGTPNTPMDPEGRRILGFADDNGLFWVPRADSQHSLKTVIWGPNGAALGTVTNPVVVASAGANSLVLDQEFVFAPNESINTVKYLDINLPTTTNGNGWAYLAITNPSTASALTVILQNKETFSYSGSPDIKYVEVTRYTLNANTPSGKVYLVQGWLLGDNSRLVVSNDTQAEVAGFTCKFRVRKV